MSAGESERLDLAYGDVLHLFSSDAAFVDSSKAVATRRAMPHCLAVTWGVDHYTALGSQRGLFYSRTYPLKAWSGAMSPTAAIARVKAVDAQWNSSVLKYLQVAHDFYASFALPADGLLAYTDIPLKAAEAFHALGEHRCGIRAKTEASRLEDAVAAAMILVHISEAMHKHEITVVGGSPARILKYTQLFEEQISTPSDLRLSPEDWKQRFERIWNTLIKWRSCDRFAWCDHLIGVMWSTVPRVIQGATGPVDSQPLVASVTRGPVDIGTLRRVTAMLWRRLAGHAPGLLWVTLADAQLLVDLTSVFRQVSAKASPQNLAEFYNILRQMCTWLSRNDSPYACATQVKILRKAMHPSRDVVGGVYSVSLLSSLRLSPDAIRTFDTEPKEEAVERRWRVFVRLNLFCTAILYRPEEVVFAPSTRSVYYTRGLTEQLADSLSQAYQRTNTFDPHLAEAAAITEEEFGLKRGIDVPSERITSADKLLDMPLVF